ncbi:polysialyltransferase family glycosyltransferase [Pseudohalioglobus lutimaris]|uniref:Uncharacterized protein n=1 Tax=Pseudohalioglobus lutimaris TaxID=1737061 RepID=A0A2N5X2E3_9GAMM|nr:polysialyltransferase family glycosyltransferase [Pseudohalioglobus lutimaris]PLW68659.1 hypothetical protein C0039_11650 [Pseudohalioglobus lutimaris]
MKIEEYDIVGYKIISPLHLATLMAYASLFRQTEARLKVLVIVSKGPWAKNILRRPDRTRGNMDITFVDEADFELNKSPLWPLYLLLKPLVTLLSKLSGRNTKPLCSPTMASVMFTVGSWRRMLRYKPVILDEGIGSFNLSHSFRQEAERQASNQITRKILAWVYAKIWNHLTALGGERVSLFSFIEGTPSINQDIAERYRATFLENYSLGKASVDLQPNTVLILTQPFSEMGICSEREMLDALKSMKEQIEEMGAQPAIKTHPAETSGKYDHLGIEQLTYAGPAEDLFAAKTQSIKEVWGFSSTSLITGSALFGLRCRRIDLDRPGASIRLFKGEALALFLHYTEPVSLKGA